MSTRGLREAWKQVGQVLLILAAASVSVAAQPQQIQQRQLIGIQHASWTPRDGAPASVMAIEQAPDGALWLGSRQGLYRFDGLHFDRITVVDEDRWSPADIYALHAMPNGDLWIGTFASGVVLLHGETATRFREGLPKSGVTQFFDDQRRGGMWVSTTMGLVRFDGKRFHPVGTEMNLPSGQSVTCVLDKNGNLLVRTYLPGLFLLRAGATSFEHLNDDQMRYLPFAIDQQLRVWESTKDGIELLDGSNYAIRARVPWTFPAFAPDVRFDRQGSLWATERGFGVIRVRSKNGSSKIEDAPSIQTFHERDGLTSEQVMCNFVDTDGDFWVGTERGLDRFHTSALTRIDSSIGAAYLGTQPAGNGSAWIIGFTGGAWLRTSQGDIVPQTQLPNDVNRITAIASDRNEGLWLSSGSGMGHLTAATWKTLPQLPEGMTGTVTAIVSDYTGGFWAAVAGIGLVHWDGHQWQVEQTVGRVAVTALAVDRGHVYIGTREGKLITVSTNHSTVTRSPSLGAITVLTTGSERLWVGGDRGLLLLQGDRQISLPIHSSPEIFRISGLLESQNGDVWFNTAVGVGRIAASRWKAVANKSAAFAEAELFDAADGVEGMPLRTFLTPTASLLSDGRMIFSTQLGLYQVDLSLTGSRTLPSTPYTVGLKADGTTVPTGTRLPPKVHALEISYGAACLRDVQRLTFRYRLTGFDHGWQSAGSRREALYTNLPPGTYGFEVQSTFDGLNWSQTSTSLPLTVPPSFAQRKSVRLLALFAVALCAWWIIRLRVKRFYQLAALRLQAQLQERERIARDLHDTLLQSIQGLILRFGAMVDNPTLDESVRNKMHQSLALAEQVVTEGRDRVRDLRGETENPTAFQGTLIETGTLLSAGTTTTFDWSVKGTPTVLQPVLADEVTLIAREAMHNAFQHAKAQQVSLHIEYAKDGIRVEVADDGVGFPIDLGDLSRPGHWGIPGMRERAKRIGASLKIEANQPKGTHIVIHAPMAISKQVATTAFNQSWLLRFLSLPRP